MSPKTVALFLALAGGTAAAFFVGRQTIGRPRDAAPAPAPRPETPREPERPAVKLIDVIVAKKDLPVGTVLDERQLDDLVTRAEFPPASVPAGVVNDLDDLKGKRLTRTVRQGNFFAAADLTTSKPAAVMPKDSFAYSLRVNPAAGPGAGFIVPGGRVDVLLVEKGVDARAKARVLVSNLLVIAVDTVSRPSEGPANAAVSTITLAVTRDQALTLAESDKLGELRPILRAPQKAD